MFIVNTSTKQTVNFTVILTWFSFTVILSWYSFSIQMETWVEIAIC